MMPSPCIAHKPTKKHQKRTVIIQTRTPGGSRGRQLVAGHPPPQGVKVQGAGGLAGGEMDPVGKKKSHKKPKYSWLAFFSQNL